MKKITRIEIDNYRAYIQSRTVDLVNGENILLYGENGSGKSSLYKGLRYFLSSSVGEGTFEINRYSGRNDGKIEITYMDFDPQTKSVIPGSEQIFQVNTDAVLTNNTDPFIKLSYRVSGFLDYSKLLKVYLHENKRPDLFPLVLNLIGAHVPTKYGGTIPIKQEYNEIIKKARSAYHRTDWNFRKARKKFENLIRVLPAVISDLSKVLDVLMTTYFPDLNLKIWLNLSPLTFHEDCYIYETWIEGHIYIEVRYFGQVMTEYNDKLNEARLSAISVCLYLASLKLNAEQVDSKILYLDDVFLGLDLGNRKPILNILLNEFKDYQIFISTYDRSWYEQAKETLSDKQGWAFYELYEGTFQIAPMRVISNPLIIKDESLFEKACKFVNNNERPDYPAAANYLRKAYEELMLNNFYEHAVREVDCELIPAYRLTKLVDACSSFVKQLNGYLYHQNNIMSALLTLKNSLHPLLHPLSHFVPGVPIYKAEVLEAIRLYEVILFESNMSAYKSHCRVFEERGHKVNLVIKGVSGWTYEYTLKLLQNLYFFDDNQGGKSLSKCECRVIKIKESMPGVEPQVRIISDTNPLSKAMTYASFEECITKLLVFLSTYEKKNDPVSIDWKDCFYISDIANNLDTVRNRIAQFVWN
jgi:energy-coupling factor transporter ATP-binding protein EcfA2